ncbi:MAG: prepilin peptidase [Lachnospiraceae bacterium]|nr:prepilin peptidase [Lachnospiraceae bacterium]
MKVLIILVLVLFLTCLWDAKKGKIPNPLILIGAFYGLLRMFYYQKFFVYIPGIIFPIIVMFPLYKIGTMGAGDLKLFAMIGFYFPFMETIYCILLAFVIAAGYSLLIMVKDKDYRERFSYLLSYVRDIFTTGNIRYYYKDFEGNDCIKENNRRKVHMAIPLFLSIFLHLGGGFL